MALTEFELIDRYFTPLMPPGAGGDDCALVLPPPECELVVSTDTLVAAVHFPDPCDGTELAWRALGCCASDLAAMGADPLGFTLALTLPDADPAWLQSFSRGLGEAAAAASLPLLGGDTTRGPLSLTLTVWGSVPRGMALRRGGAAPGDRVFVSGYLGAAAAALGFLDRPEQVPELIRCYWRVQPRLALGQALRGVASAALDISDGLLADLGHLCAASGCGARLDPARVPLHPSARAALGEEQARSLALSGGDDYELCFAVPPARLRCCVERAAALGVKVTEVGELVGGSGIRSVDGAALDVNAGYRHFGAESC